jgi:hypothetical protein
MPPLDIHILDWGDENVAERDHPGGSQQQAPAGGGRLERTFSCLRRFSNFSSRYVCLAKKGVVKGCVTFLMATF